MAGSSIEFPSTGEVFAFSVTDNMSPSRSADVTEHEVEDGASVSDHRIRNAKTINISGFVTDVPFDAVGNYDPQNPDGMHVFVRERLERADESSEFINIDLGPTRGTYENMLITSLDFSWDPDTGNGLQVSLSAKEVRIANVKTRNLKKEAIINQQILTRAESEFDVLNRAALGTGMVAKDKFIAQRFEYLKNFERTTLKGIDGVKAGIAKGALESAGDLDLINLL